MRKTNTYITENYHHFLYTWRALYKRTSLYLDPNPPPHTLASPSSPSDFLRSKALTDLANDSTCNIIACQLLVPIGRLSLYWKNRLRLA